MSMIQSKPVQSTPGDTLRAMTRAHADETGRVWPAGTEYRPLAGGADNERGGRYQSVSIEGGGTATFREV